MIYICDIFIKRRTRRFPAIYREIQLETSAQVGVLDFADRSFPCGPSVRDHDISATVASNRRLECRIDGIVARHIARKDERVVECRGELADIFLETLARIGEREARARSGSRLRNRPRDGALVGDANNQTMFSRQVTQRYFDRLRPGPLRRLRPWGGRPPPPPERMPRGGPVKLPLPRLPPNCCPPPGPR